MELTQKQKEHYVKVANNHCPDPDCGSDDIEGGMIQVDSGRCFQCCSCNECNLEWQDIYKLIDITVTS